MRLPATPTSMSRRLVLGAALAFGVAAACWQPPGLVNDADAATTTSAPASGTTTTAGAPAAGTAGTRTGDGANKPDAGDAGAGAPTGTGNPNLDLRISPQGVEVTPPAESESGHDKRIEVRPGHVTVQGFGRDHEYDSFEQFTRDAPGTALFVFLIVTVVFLVPLLVVALLVWYKIRRTRMQHDAMLKLAERGVVSPATAMEALAGGVSPAATLDALSRATAGPGSATAGGPGGAPGNTPLYEQARMIRRRTAWSDLRKGVILIAIGVGLSAYSMFNDGTPNGAGLICLFLGIGYCVLWYFQDRPVPSPNQSPPAPPGGA